MRVEVGVVQLDRVGRGRGVEVVLYGVGSYDEVMGLGRN